MKKYTIYALLCPMSNEIVYVGLTECLDKRIKQHRTYSRGKALNKWYATLSKQNKRQGIKAIILEGGLGDYYKAVEKEKSWIRKLSETHTLFNIRHNVAKEVAPEIHMTISDYEKLSGKKINPLKAA